MKKRILALTGIGLLLAMYLINAVLALIGSPDAVEMLKVSAAMTVLIPLVLYGFLVVAKAGRKHFGPDIDPSEEPEEENTTIIEAESGEKQDLGGR